MELQEKVAVVTGGAVRLGRAMSLALAGEGAAVAVHYRSSATAAHELVDEIETAGGQAFSVQADLSHPVAAARTIIAAAIERYGRVDVLVNSAAIFESGRLADTNEDQFDRHIDVNLKGPLYLCQAFAAGVTADRQAHIVNIADWRATRPQPGHLSYTLAKGGLVTLTKVLARELAPNIQVNCICPGAILLPAGADSVMTDQLASRNPLGRMGDPSDVARTLMHLLRSDFITGEVVHVTGGEQL